MFSQQELWSHQEVVSEARRPHPEVRGPPCRVGAKQTQSFPVTVGHQIFEVKGNSNTVGSVLNLFPEWSRPLLRKGPGTFCLVECRHIQTSSLKTESPAGAPQFTEELRVPPVSERSG